MHYKTILLSFFFFAITHFGLAQQDTLHGKSEEVIVTATRSERKLSNIAVPAIIVQHKNIQQTGSLKLQDILQEQTGITIVNSTLATSLNGYPNPFGQGVQMLGLDPAYTAILIDGEPLVGRNGGILKLGRIATGNINKIEIVKGPSSSLYGSEAMAGVINILTNSTAQKNVEAQIHASTNNTFGFAASYANSFKKTGLQIFANHYSTNGYDLDEATYGKTIDAYRDINAHLKLTHPFSKQTQLLVSARVFNSKQNNDYQIYQSGIVGIVKGFTIEKDHSFFAQLKHVLKHNQKIYCRTFVNTYANNAFVNLENTAITFDETNFKQIIVKPEIQFESNKKINQNYVAGVGAYFETVNASRYAGKQNLQTFYTFSQKEWHLYHNKLTTIAGLRLDKRTDFKTHFSPRIAMAFRPNSFIKITASAGYGFKAPDFRHMFLNFYNNQIGYSLIGANILAEELQKMQQQGMLQAGANISNYTNNQTLLPEKSFGWHTGITYNKNNISAEADVFRNDIDNLIDVYILPFKKSNNNNIYSYYNINKIFTEGIELNFKYNFSKNFYISTGYQYLNAKDKQVLQQISDGKIFKRDPITYQTTLVTKQNYFGLANKSKHSVNAKLLWKSINEKNTAYIRFVYKGKFGFTDVNGNNIIDDEREMVPGFWLTNIAITKKIHHNWDAQIGVENLFNYTNVQQLPNYSGRIFFINLNYSFNQNFK